MVRPLKSIAQSGALAPSGAAVYLLTWAALLNLLWVQALAGALLSGAMAAAHLRLRHGWVVSLAGAAWLILLWPLALPCYWASVWLGGAALLAPLRAATLAPLAVLALGAGWGVVAAARAPEFKEPADLSSELNAARTASQQARKDAVMALLESNPFEVPWWLSNGHAQSFWGPIVRRRLAVEYRAERWDTPDGDFVYVKFLDGDPDAPLVLLLHGLEGSANSPYMKGFNLAFQKLGWNVATLEFRFCSGEINRAKRIYHMGETSDCDFVARRLAERFPDKPIFMAGFSLGGNVLAKWLGESGANVPRNLRAAAVISPPFDPGTSAPSFHKILGGFYARNFLKTLKPKALAKARQYPGVLDVKALAACEDFYTYDTIVTAAFHGFEDAEDYWRKVGCHQFLDGIRVPTMLLTSADDPFNPAETIPHEKAETSPWLHPQWTERGGHVGFVMGASPLRPRYWTEEQTVTFFRAYEELNR